MLTFGSLFSGFGGLDLGLERAGLKCRCQVESEPYAIRVLEKNFGRMLRHDDARTFPTRPVQQWQGVDIIVGGDPCQENSNARQRTGLESPRLGGEFVRILDALRPRMFLRENPTAVRSDAPWPWWRFRSAAESIGYVVLPFRLRACCLGADHRRDRLFLLGELSDAVQTRLEGNVFQEMARPAASQRLGDAARQDWGNPQSRVLGKHHGIPNRVERTKGYGNAVHVACGEWIGRRIIESVPESLLGEIQRSD